MYSKRMTAKQSVSVMAKPVRKAPGDRYTLIERVERLHEIREGFENGENMSVRRIMVRFNVSLDTANNWRKAAMALISNDDQGFNRKALRHIQVGRIQRKIEQLEHDLTLAEGVKERALVHQQIRGYYSEIARITGINSETLEVEHIAPLAIQRAEVIEADVKALPTDTAS